jgi:hypothetical protein
VKSIAAVALFALLALVGAGNGSRSGSGLRGTVVIYPASPTCQPGTPCTRPAAHTLLRFSHGGNVVARVRTDARGRFRIALRPRTYRVTSIKGATLKPSRVTVATGSYRRVTFTLDTGIR